ncbi:M57 family metalloprotease [Candidatus Nitrosopelagicus sp.]|nr:M57 family metalloprotease [Candidatus Nitrosopelagicus sp.]
MNRIEITKIALITGTILVLFLSPSMNISLALETNDMPKAYKKANEHFMQGEYHQAIELYDEILEISPTNIKSSLMKGIALSNLERHKSSILEFYNINKQNPENVTALIGLGIGFGNFGEYKQALTYFEQAYKLSPENHIVKNYYEFATKTVEKYPYNEVEKPEIFTLNIPQVIPSWIKNTAGWWANDQIPDEEFLKGINFLVDNGILVIDLPNIEELTEDEERINDRNDWEFSRYIDRIEKTVSKDKRYIEYPNPSNDVIKKFLRDYVKWNYDQQIEIGNKNFPNPEYRLIDNVYYLEYKIYVNDQPDALPLDHVSTLVNSFKVWEDEEFEAKDGKKVKINFVTTKTKTNANLWVTWVVRDMGEGVLGHANLGKGIVEVALGGYGCDGNFQLFHVDTVEYIMTHELGHGIGLPHSEDKNSIMFPSMKNTQYAYCMLDVDKKINTGSIILKND